jgi:8-oxo-dGTP pyrophosphatase MutT (NUDIX family)
MSFEEHFDICDSQGRPTGRKEARSVAHQSGLWHRSAHLWLANARDEFLLQRRHPEKQTDPGRWDIAVAGHLSAGQSPVAALIREAFEELGLVLEASELAYLEDRRKEYQELGFVDREFQSVFVLRREVDLAELVLQETEVTEVAWEPAWRLAQRLEAGDESLVNRRGEWQDVYRLLGLDPILQTWPTKVVHGSSS